MGCTDQNDENNGGTVNRDITTFLLVGLNHDCESRSRNPDLLQFDFHFNLCAQSALKATANISGSLCMIVLQLLL